jgi:hypothetical protein
MNPVHSLWIGDDLSAMEQLSMRSFLANGHEFRLYTYEPVTGVPAGVVQNDAREVLPASAIFRYRDCGSYSGFADHFRYKLLLEHGGWWCDLDMVCLQPLPAPGEYVFASELTLTNIQTAANGVMFAHRGAPALQYMWDIASRKDPAKLSWCETGAPLLADAVAKYSLEQFVLPYDAFCPIPCFRWYDTFLPGHAGNIGPASYCVHFYNEL